MMMYPVKKAWRIQNALDSKIVPRTPKVRVKPAIQDVGVCDAKQQKILTARKGKWPSASGVVHQVFCGSETMQKRLISPVVDVLS